MQMYFYFINILITCKSEKIINIFFYLDLKFYFWFFNSVFKISNAKIIFIKNFQDYKIYTNYLNNYRWLRRPCKGRKFLKFYPIF